MSVYEKDISRVHIGQPIRFALSADIAPEHSGRIFLIGKTISADRTIPVLAEPTGRTDEFIPGAYVSARIAVASQSVPTLPDAAVVRLDGQSFVYVLLGKGGSPITYRFRQISVTPGSASGGYMAVNLPASVHPQQTPVVVSGAYSLLAKLNNSEEE
jgi:membrane fusion protein, heavy metal efflux system